MPAAVDDGNTAQVVLTLRNLDLARDRGPIRAFADVAVNVNGVEFTLCGCRVIERRAGETRVEGPTYKRGAQWLPCTVLPAEIIVPLGKLIGEQYFETIGRVAPVGFPVNAE